MPSSFFVSLLFEGIIWFLLPTALVIVNDIMAYLAGVRGGCGWCGVVGSARVGWCGGNTLCCIACTMRCRLPTCPCQQHQDSPGRGVWLWLVWGGGVRAGCVVAPGDVWYICRNGAFFVAWRCSYWILWSLLPAPAGFFFGRTPLIQLSPKKTWEGFLGGCLGTGAGGTGHSNRSWLPGTWGSSAVMISGLASSAIFVFKTICAYSCLPVRAAGLPACPAVIAAWYGSLLMSQFKWFICPRMVGGWVGGRKRGGVVLVVHLFLL